MCRVLDSASLCGGRPLRFRVGVINNTLALGLALRTPDRLGRAGRVAVRDLLPGVSVVRSETARALPALRPTATRWWRNSWTGKAPRVDIPTLEYREPTSRSGGSSPRCGRRHFR